jgi:hypothetical protein
MKKTILFVFALLISPTMLLAQSEWSFDRILLKPDSTNFVGGVHGLAVDGEGKLWIAEWAGGSSIHVYNADGSLASFSPVTSFTVGETTLNVALGTNRGMRTDHNGDILIANGANLVRVNHLTGQATLIKAIGVGPLTSPGVDSDGNILVSGVLPGNAFKVIGGDDFEDIVTIKGELAEFRRTNVFSPDGTRAYELSYTKNHVRIYESAEGVFGEYALVDTTSIVGVAVEAAAFSPDGLLWISAGSKGDRPNRYVDADSNLVPTNWTLNTWYALDPADGYAVKDSIAWDGYDFVLEPDIRPRAIAFSNDGNTVYLGMFNSAPMQVFKRGDGVSVRRGIEMVDGFALSQNYPNPFNPTTTINYTIPEAAFVTLKVYDLLGREVATLVNGVQSAGDQQVTFNASNLTSGVYMYVMESNGYRFTNKMMLMK